MTRVTSTLDSLCRLDQRRPRSSAVSRSGRPAAAVSISVCPPQSHSSHSTTVHIRVSESRHTGHSLPLVSLSPPSLLSLLPAPSRRPPQNARPRPVPLALGSLVDAAAVQASPLAEADALLRVLPLSPLPPLFSPSRLRRVRLALAPAVRLLLFTADIPDI